MTLSFAPREHARLVRGASDRLVIALSLIPELKSRGIYGERGDQVPDRYLSVDRLAAESLCRLERDYPGVFSYSDLFRDANGSRVRRIKNRERRKRQGKSARFVGKLPGSSGHNYGLCSDDDLDGDPRKGVEGNLERLAGFLGGKVTKGDYDAVKREYGWYCHRDGPVGGNHDRGPEDWHYNFLGDDPERWLDFAHRTTAAAVEAKIQYIHGPFVLDAAGIDEHLQRLGHTPTSSGIAKFQRDWTLPQDGVAGPQTQRALLYVGAEFRKT